MNDCIADLDVACGCLRCQEEYEIEYAFHRASWELNKQTK